MALLASKRVRKNITAQIWNGGGARDNGGMPTVIAFMKAGIPIPGEIDNRFGAAHETTMFDYCNETLNWSSQDGAGGTNRGNYLGYVVMPAGVSNGMFSSDENGMYFSGPLSITMIAEGEIGSVLVYHSGHTVSTVSAGISNATVPATTGNFSGHNIAIGEGTSLVWYSTIAAPTGIGYDGTTYVKNQSQIYAGTMFYQNVLFATNSVGTTVADAVMISGTYISNSTPITLENINLKISEAF